MTTLTQKDKKYKVGYDYHGVASRGVKLVPNSVIITGSPKEKESELRKVVPDNIPIHFYDGVIEKGNQDELIGQWKADKVKELGLVTYYESQKAQAKIIQEQNPDVKVVANPKVLIISDEWLAPSLALKMQTEGCSVYVALKRQTNILKGSIKRIPYDTRLDFAKDCDLVIYEDKSNRNESSDLRKTGKSVIGGDKLTDKLELNRTWANKIVKSLGMLAPEMIEVDSFEKVAQIIQERGGKWVLKQQGKIDEIKGLNFVSKMENSEDLLDFLPILEKEWVDEVKKDFVLQEKIEGHEMAIGSFWNGKEFMKDKDGDELCEENWEHKPLFPGGLGESTGEQYTVQRMVKAKYSKLFSETLDKCRPLLNKIDYRGDFDVNSIVTEKGAYFLEFTPRMGVPATSGMLEIHKTKWYDFLKAMADGGQVSDFQYDPNFCIVSWLYTKPFPSVFTPSDKENPQGLEEIKNVLSNRMSNSEGIVVNFQPTFTNEDWNHIHPDGVRFQDGKLKIANTDGYILTASKTDETVEGAGKKLDDLFRKIVVPKAFWRNDFDDTNYHKSKDDLMKWGYIFSSQDIAKKSFDESQSKKKEEKRTKIRGKLKEILL